MKLEEVKRCLNKPVRYETAGGDREYLLTGCILRKNDKGYFYQAELQDIANQNSILICRLDDVKAGGVTHGNNADDGDLCDRDGNTGRNAGGDEWRG